MATSGVINWPLSSNKLKQAPPNYPIFTRQTEQQPPGQDCGQCCANGQMFVSEWADAERP